MAGTLKYSDALANFLLSGGSLKEAMDGGRIEIFLGSQPATPDLTITLGDLLAVITDASGAITPETPATSDPGAFSGSGAGGTPSTIDDYTVDGYDVLGEVITWDTDLTTTLALVAYGINQNPQNKWVTATSDATKVYLTGKPGVGALLNGKALAVSITQNDGSLVAAAQGNMGDDVSGIDGFNGLELGVAVDQVLGKKTGQIWSGVGVHAGTQTAGFFRMYASWDDDGTDEGSIFKRLDGNIATSGATMNMSNTSIVNAAVQTITAVALTQPES